jgi:hypothetical protein
MCEADCNEYGWDNGWNSDPYFEDNWVYLSGVSWPGEANEVVGYIKFRYHSGEVVVSITPEYSDAFDANCQSVEFSDKTLVFGEPDPNDFGEEGDSFEQNSETNDVKLPLSDFWQNEQEKRQKNSMHCPAGLGSDSVTFGKAAYEAYKEKDSEKSLALESTKDSGGGALMELDSVIEINSDITTNQLWTANNTYYITSDVNVQALLVIEPGTVIYFSQYGSLAINNGGTLISSGTPDNPIIYTSDTGYGWGDYYCAIEVQETASPATKITYSYIDCAYIAILTSNIRLDTPIENNYLFYNNSGIREYGTHHTDIVNNLIFYSYNEYYYSDGIEVYMESEEGAADANSFILIQNNTCDYQDYGITTHGTEDGNYIGLAMLVNNIVSKSAECGLNLVDYYIIGIVSNTGYGANTANKNWEFEEDNPVEVTENPYIEGQGVLDIRYLNQNCPFIDAGLEYVEEVPLIGKTTDITGLPDCNKIDIGFHYPNWQFSNAGITSLLADLNNDFTVDYKDLEIFADYWLSPFDFIDFSILANEWGQTTTSSLPAISISINGDANNLKGEISVSVTGCSGSTAEVFVFMDGQLLGNMNYEFGETPGVTTDSASYLNGSHLFKALVIDYNNLITLSENLAVDFNNPLQCLSINDTYEPNQPLRLLGISATDSNLMVKLSKWNGETIWSQQTSGNLDMNIPGDVLAGQIYDMSIEQEITGLQMLDSSWEPVWEKAIAAKYDLNESYKFAIFLPTAYYTDLFPFFDSADSRKKAVAGIINGCDIMGIKYIILYRDQCTWENFKRVLTGPRASSIINVYLVSRGAASLPGATAQRTYFKLSDGYVVSNLNTPLGGGRDGKSYIHSMASLGLGGTDQLKLVWIDICFNGLYNDMASAWMKFENPILDKLYVSWNGGIQTSNESCFCDWTAFFFGYPDPNNGFGLYGANTYYQAFEDACRWDHVCDSAFISGKVQTYGDTSVRFTGDRDY